MPRITQSQFASELAQLVNQTEGVLSREVVFKTLSTMALRFRPQPDKDNANET